MNKPIFKPAKSSNIEATAYDAATNTLHVRFMGGATYTYDNVPPALYEAMHKAPSIGKFVNSQIIGKFKTTKG